MEQKLNILFKNIRNSLKQNKTFILPNNLNIDFNPKISQLFITLFQENNDSIRWGSKQKTLEQTIQRITFQLKLNPNFHKFNIQNSNKCRILFEIVTKQYPCNIRNLNTTKLHSLNRFEPGINGLKYRYKNKTRYFMPTDSYTKSIMGINQLLNHLSKQCGISKKSNTIIQNASIEYTFIKSNAFLSYKDEVVELFRGLPKDIEFNTNILYDKTIKSIDWLIENMNEDGSFLYFYDPYKNTVVDDMHPKMINPLYNNILRHSGGTIALLKGYEISKNKLYLQKAKESIDFLISTFQTHKYKKQFACYPFFNKKSKLGGAGIGLVALMQYYIHTQNETYRKQIDGLVRHILSRVDKHGEMIGYYKHPKFNSGRALINPSDDIKKELFSFYYPGEALLALALYYLHIKNIDKNLKEDIKIKSELALNFLVDIRPIKYKSMFKSLPSDAWLMQAIEQWVKVDGFKKQSYIDFVFNDTKAMFEHMYNYNNVTTNTIDYIGGFYYNYGDHVYHDASRCEGVISAYYLAKYLNDDKKVKLIEKNLLLSTKGLMKTFYDEVSTYPHINPQKALHSFRFKLTRQWVRVDSVQHAVSLFARIYISDIDIEKITTQEQTTKIIDGYTVIKHISQSGYSNVFLVEDKNNPTKQLVLKLMSQPYNIKLIQQEQKALNEISHHKNCVDFYGMHKYQKDIYFLFDYIENGNLNHTTLSEQQGFKLLTDILSVLKLTKKLNILHLDIKKANILYDKQNFYLIDWGLSQPSNSTKFPKYKGNAIYKAPEIYNNNGCFASDIYSLGVTIFNLINKKPLFGLKNYHTLEKKIYSHTNLTVEFSDNISDKTKHILTRMLDKNPKTRATIDEIENILQDNHEKLLLQASQLANITDGYWENLDSSIIITGVNYLLKNIKQGNLFITFNPKQWNERKYSNEDEIEEAFKNGAVAAIVRSDSNIKSNKPLLRVTDTKIAFRNIATTISNNTKATKVLVTGSFGKTEFKFNLNHIAKDQMKTHAVLSSANKNAGIFKTLSTIKNNDKLVIVEVAVPYSIGKKRASYVNPDICVITSIGHEHIERHKTIEKLVEHKVAVVSALKTNGKVIIPKQSDYYDLIIHNLKKYGNFNILTFGNDASCNAQLLNSTFNNFGWDIKARIENTIINYRINFIESHAPINSLASLLCAYHLGLDIKKSASKFNSCIHYKSSGNLYRLLDDKKQFMMYDQSYRGGIESYIEFFKTIAITQPKGHGKKIVITSEFVDYKDGEMDNIDTKLFQELIKNTNIDIFYSVEKFNKHKNVLDNTTISNIHGSKHEDIEDKILSNISNDDIIFIKGIFESDLPKLSKKIKKLYKQNEENIMDKFYRFSQSPIWQIQKDYYKQLGIDTWGKAMVPFVATTNNFVANGYAQTIHAFILDIQQTNNKDFPINIIELGTGHGRFSFMLLNALNKIYGNIDNPPFRYIMTDIAPISIEAWKNHPKLKPFINTGILDFALFDAVTQEDTQLIISKKSLKQTIKDKPTVIVANFILDVLPYDLFKIQNGTVNQCKVSMNMENQITKDDSTDKIIDNISLTQQYTKCEDNYYQDEKLDRLLEYYKNNIDNSIVQFPLYILKTIDYFRNLSKNSLWLIGEEANIKLEQLEGNSSTGIKKEGSFTTRVNLHAITKYLENENTILLSSNLPDQRYDNYAILNNIHTNNYAMTKNMFLQTQVLFGPRSFFRFVVSLSRSETKLTDDGILSLLELSKYDPYIVHKFKNIILDICLTTKGFKQKALVKALLKTWNNYYDIGEDFKYAYYIGRMLKRLKASKEALQFFNMSITKNKHNNSIIYYQMGKVSLDLNHKNNAIKFFQTAIKLNSANNLAKKELDKLNQNKIYLHNGIKLKEDDTISGLGLIATSKIKKNEIVWQASKNHLTYKMTDINSWSQEKQKEFKRYSYECEKEYFLLDGTIGKYMNHSCNPNCVWQNNRTLIAKDDINIDDEITYDYSTAQLSRNLKMNCKCGSDKCRKIITNHDYKNIDFQQQYGKNLPSHILEAIKYKK